MIMTQTARGANGMVAAGHPLATDAAVAVLKDGGNAVDASVAAALVLAVVCPYASTLGGDVYLLIYGAADERLFGLNGTGRAPMGAAPEIISDGIPRTGPRAVTVPGFIDGLEAALARFGARSLADLIQPAIGLARDGVTVNRVLEDNTRNRAALIAANQAASALFLPGGAHLREGDVLLQSDLAECLEQIAQDGARVFYEGDLARRVADGCAAAGGLITADDLARHESLWQNPICVPFAGHEVATMPPNSYGLTLLLQLLRLEAGGIGDVEPDSAEFARRGIDARTHAYNAAAGLIGDPDELDAPARAYLSQAMAGTVAGAEGDVASETGGGCTTNVVAMDGAGNAVSLIQSISAPYGSGVVAAGTGILLNNRMGGFSTDPGSPNRLAPGRRPAHTLAPCMVLKDGRPVLSIGTPGAAGQTCTLAQILTRTLACGQALDEAIAAPRWSVHVRGGAIVEDEMDETLRAGIEEYTPELKTMPAGWQTFGSVKAVAAGADGFTGFADGRRCASAAGC